MNVLDRLHVMTECSAGHGFTGSVEEFELMEAARDRIAELEAENNELVEELRRLYSGAEIVIPKDRAHAEAMHLMACRFLGIK